MSWFSKIDFSPRKTLQLNLLSITLYCLNSRLTHLFVLLNRALTSFSFQKVWQRSWQHEKQRNYPTNCLDCADLTQRRVKQDRKQMSQQQLRRSAGFLEDGATASCVSFRLSVHVRDRPLAFWEKPYLEMRTPPAYAITPYITSLKALPLCVCVCSGGPLTLAESGRTGGATQRDETERNQWSESANNESVCVRETASEWDNIPQNPLVLLALVLRVPSRDRTSHVRFQNSSQFLLHKYAHIFKRYIYNHKGSFFPNWVPMCFKLVHSKRKMHLFPLEGHICLQNDIF